MKVEEVRPKNPPYTRLPQCSAPVPMESHWSPTWLTNHKEQMQRIGYDPNRCSRGGTVKVDGKPFCRQHAGTIAVEELIKLSRAERLEGTRG